MHGNGSKLAASVTALPPTELLNGLTAASLVQFGGVWKAKILRLLFAVFS